MEELFPYLELSELDLKQKLYNELLEKNMNPISEDGFLYAEGELPILLVAHMDTVFPSPPETVYYSRKNLKIFSKNSSVGLGADDRCGVYAIMKILEEYKPSVLFTEREEIGGIGAKLAVQKLPKPNVKYIIEFDRRGSNDCVFYGCKNEEFKEYIESFGFCRSRGSFSDISILGKEWDIAAVNLSCGYYNAHTPEEYIKFKELEYNIERTKIMLSKLSKAKYFDYQNSIYNTPEEWQGLISYLWLPELKLKEQLYNELIEKNMKPICEDGFLYAEGELPILLVAHMDTVFSKQPEEVHYRYNSSHVRICSNNPKIGIGADDRCGIYAIMKILEKYKPSVLFTEREEIGGIGAKLAVQKLPKPNVKYIIEFDRRGSNDCVFYGCKNEEFIEYIESFGFCRAEGSFSDISVLGREWNIAAVNLSCGYYKEHTPDEYIEFRELEYNIERAEKMLNKCINAKYYQYKNVPNNTPLTADEWQELLDTLLSNKENNYSLGRYHSYKHGGRHDK